MNAEPIDKTSHDGLRAVAETNALLGFDIRAVLSDDTWFVVLVDGEPLVTINTDAMRALAQFSPRPNAGEITEQIIDAMRQATS